ncbi:P-loop containing nucleoside triphosphate hydrolase protein [Neoconidiobolus thromboides FSU 785]|nr:P-loop containing nucleoside triphosphate hydrolase protein [Neoconidiobolus thromboides FSU 785]
MAETETIESLEKRIKELNFEDLGLHPQLLESIQKLFPNIEPTKLKPTEIQALAVPELLKNNKSHILLAAETGSGKTLAYLLPIISKLKSEEGNDLRLLSTTDLRKLNRPRAIVLVPSCALAEQVYAVSKKISHLVKFRAVLLTRSTVRKDFLRRLNTPFDILVTTPASLKRYLLTGNLSLSEVTQMAIDEADTMFEKGFAGDVKDIIDGVKKTNEKLKRSYQIQIVSATLPKLVLQTLDKLFPNILKITTPSLHKALPNCKQHFVDLKDYQGNRQLALLDILRQFDQRTSSTAQQKSRDRIIIFCNTRKSVSIAQTFLMDRKIPSISLYGKDPFPNTPPATEKEIQQFLYPSSPTVSSSYAFSSSTRETETDPETDTTIDKNPKILLCTDIASRGLDTTSVNHVILYDFPTSVVDFLHRCGRTARAGKSGIVTALVGKKDRSLSERIKRSIRTKTVLS